MPVVIGIKTLSCWKIITSVIVSCIASFIINILIALVIFFSYLNSKQEREMEPLEFQKWKAPIEMLLTGLISSPTACFIFAYANLDISYKPAPKAGSGPLEQRAAIDGSNAENTATKRPIGKNEPQATVWLTLADRDGQHDNPKGEDVDEKGQSTVQVSEQLVQAAIGAWTHSDDTTLNTNATPTPPRLFLRRMSTASDWQRETLTQILAISRAHDASEAMRSAPNQTFNEVNNKTPSTPCPIIRRYTPPSTPTGPKSSGRSLLSASASPDPSFASAGVLPSSPASSPSFFLGKEWKTRTFTGRLPMAMASFVPNISSSTTAPEDDNMQMILRLSIFKSYFPSLGPKNTVVYFIWKETAGGREREKIAFPLKHMDRGVLQKDSSYSEVVQTPPEHHTR